MLEDGQIASMDPLTGKLRWAVAPPMSDRAHLGLVVSSSAGLLLHAMWGFANDGWWCPSNPGCGVRVGNSQAAGDRLWRTVAYYDYTPYLPTGTVASKLIGAAVNLWYADGITAPAGVAVRHATSFSWCGVSYSQTPPCTDYTPWAGYGVIDSGSVQIDLTAKVNQYWYAGAPLLAWAFSGDETSGWYTYKEMGTSFSLTYDRLPIVFQTNSSPPNGYTVHNANSGLQYSVPAVWDPDGEVLYYRFVSCTQPSWASCTVKDISPWLTAASYSAWVLGPPPSWINQPHYWGVQVSNDSNRFVLQSGWFNSWTWVNGQAQDPQLIAPADGFRWAPNAPPNLTIDPSDLGDPDGDEVSYRFVIREPTATGAFYRSDWTAATWAVTPLSWRIPANAPLKAGQKYEWGVELRDSMVAFYRYYYGNEPQVAVNSVRTTRLEQRLGASGPSPVQSLGPVTVNVANGNATTTVNTTSLQSLGGAIGSTFTYNSRAQDVGLRARLYSDSNGNGTLDAGEFRSERVDPAVDFSWTSTEAAPGITNLQGTWTGYITVPSTGAYNFALASDDKANLNIGAVTNAVAVNQTGGLVSIPANNLSSLTPSNYTSTYPNATATVVNMTAGTPYRVTLNYRNQSGPGHLVLMVVAPGGSTYTRLPVTWLAPDAPVLPRGWSVSHQSAFPAVYTTARVEATQIVLGLAGGSTLSYMKNGVSPPGFTPPTGEDDVVSLTGDGQVTVTDSEGYVYKFRTDGQLDTITPHLTPVPPQPQSRPGRR